MSEIRLENVNLSAPELLPTPAEIKGRLPVAEPVANSVMQGRRAIQRILDREDPRLFVVTGPCSIHDLEAAREYAGRLKTLAEEVGDTLRLVMRVYFEKPRTSTGWKGFINDPYIDDSFHIEKGLEMARSLLLEVAEMGLPAGTEALDPISPQYLSDLISWYAIGARTTESQTHREMASGLSAPVGFKNGTDGNLAVAINALHAASSAHHFLGINQAGQCAVFRTRGNAYGHVVLRGGGGRPNYGSVDVAICEKELRAAGLAANVVVDCSHANSNKDYRLQPLVMDDCVNQIVEGNQSIVGFMLESNLHEGNQPIPEDVAQLRYGVSVTDACMDWPTTESLIRKTHRRLRPVIGDRVVRRLSAV
jgi:3-deoxy-7-phosphoheptulonate synthase